jgi:Holliday junction resolvase
MTLILYQRRNKIMPGSKQKASDNQLIESYHELGSIWLVGKKFNMCGQSVQERLKRLGIPLNCPTFTDEEKQRLKREYLVYRDAGKLNNLAESMGRTKPFICRKAKELDLTNPSHKKVYASVWKYMLEDTARIIFDDFKNSRGTMREYCSRKKYDELGFSRTLQHYFPDEWDVVIESKVPKQTMYRLGRALEYRCRDYFKKRGYFTLRSPRSAGKVDVVAIRAGEILFIQCKRSGSLGVKEWNGILELSISVGAVPLMAMVNPSGRGIDFYELIGRKDGSKRKQPMCAWHPKIDNRVVNEMEQVG